VNITITNTQNGLKGNTDRLLQRMLDPLCGMNPQISCIDHAHGEPSVLTMGADLCGAHILQKLPPPKRGSQHIGGSGIHLEEALIRTLGETVERYSQLVAELECQHKIIFASFDQMLKRKAVVIPAEKLNFFSSQQFARDYFPFQDFTTDKPISWVQAESFISREKVWIPAQMLFVGYKIKHDLDEPWLSAAVTTGTAAHTSPLLALRNALLELIQIDSAMGHWYSNAKAIGIEFDDRTRPLERVLMKCAKFAQLKPSFYWLDNPDLAGISVACVFRKVNLPKVAIGLGIDTCLVDAMYKAFLEAIGVFNLSKLVLLEEKFKVDKDDVDPANFYDFDANIAYYARGGNTKLFNKKFPPVKKTKARKLPADIAGDPAEQVSGLINSFRRSGKELVHVDITSTEARELGFVVSRVWSPDTLSLSLPSAAHLQHPRFKAYGGISHDAPHPYP